MKRRKFLQASLFALAGTAKPFKAAFSIQNPARKFKISLNPGIIGVKANFSETLDYAIQYGYEAISPFTREVMQNYSEGQLSQILGKMKDHDISYDSTNIPVRYRLDEATFKDEFKNLKKFCQTMERQGATRINTWIISSHEELSYKENMLQHAFRLGECARVMKDHGISLGLEYLGTRPMVSRSRYPFISSMKECKTLIGEIDEKNVGMVLDTYHWYCANESIEDIRSLSPEDVITVDINDARKGFTRETLVDGKRELPMATGVINIREFLQGLVDIGYAGPLRTEPFNQELNEMENDLALKANMLAIKKSLASLGLV